MTSNVPGFAGAPRWRGLIFCAVMLTKCFSQSAADTLELDVQATPKHDGAEIRLKGTVPSRGVIEARALRTTDFRTWTPAGQKVRVSGVREIPQHLLLEERSDRAFFRLMTRPSSHTATDGAEVLGYVSSFDDHIEALGRFDVTDFESRFQGPGRYLDKLSWDPTTAQYWKEFSEGHLKPSPWPWLPPWQVPGMNFTAAEMEALRAHGFVVTERLAKDSFGDVYYDIFTRDLPVFVSSDSVLHAWHRSFDAVLQLIEEISLRPRLRSVLLAMLGELPKVRNAHGAGPLAESIEDVDYFLNVAAHLCSTEVERASAPQLRPANLARFQETLELIRRAEPVFGFKFFDKGAEWVDFSQYIVRGHYARREALGNFFQAMMWLGRVDFRVAGNPEYASLRQLGSAILLNHLLNESGQRESWRKIDAFLDRFIGPSDSMNLDQLQALLNSVGIRRLEDVRSLADLEAIRAQMESGELGVQAIQGHGFLGSVGNDQIKLPRSCAFLGQRFTVDSWTFNQVVMDRIVLPGSTRGELVRRRIPYSLDVAFAVFGNDFVVKDLVGNMGRRDGVPFRDGFPYQRNLAAVRLTLDARPAESWKSSLYDQWLFALRTLSAPTLSPDFPEAMRTRAWAMKTLNTQLASWTQLRHDAILYVKQSETPPITCLYPYGFVEPRVPFWRAMRELAAAAAEAIEPVAFTMAELSSVYGEGLPLPGDFFRDFARRCEVLEAIATKELRQEALNPVENAFLKNWIERVDTYFGERQYNGNYPSLFYWGGNGNGVIWRKPGGAIPTGIPPDHDSVYPDFLVADVHTDGPSEPDGDPGAVLHEAVGRVNLMIIAIDNGPDRMIFGGPVMSHYEFQTRIGDRLTDEQWRSKVETRKTSAPPPWTQAYLIRE